MSSKKAGQPRNPLHDSIPLQIVAMHYRARDEREEKTEHGIHDLLLQEIWRDYVVAGVANHSLLDYPTYWSKYAMRLANSLNLPGVHE